MPLFDRFRKKKTAASEAASEHATRHCFVLCKSIPATGFADANNIVKEVLGPQYSTQQEGQDNDIVTVMRGAEILGFLAPIPAAIPGGEAEENADWNFLWPNGREEAATHQAHVIVTTMSVENQTPILSALAVSQLALVALRLFDGIGVYWGNGNVCNSRGVFEEFCRDLAEGHLPVPVWLRFQLVPNDDESVGIYTLGMRQFGLMDLEVDQCELDVGELFEFVANVAQYLIQRGPVIADGNTVGGSEDQRILVRHRPSMLDKSKKVYKIEFEG